MKTIQIVTNSDRCHCSVNGSPIATFIFSGYQDKTEVSKKDHAIHDAKVECFNQLAFFNNNGVKAQINTKIEAK